MSELNNNLNNKNKQRLGRGLGSLLSVPQAQSSPAILEKNIIPATNENKNTDTAATESAPHQAFESRIWNISIDKLFASEFQPRNHFDVEALEELAKSIKEKGVLQPIVARKANNNKFEIIAGERRWRAAQKAGLHDVPVLLKTLSNKEALEIAIIENIQREDLNPIEEAEAYQRLMDEFSLTQQEASEKIGKERATIANSVRLLTLPIEVREYVKTKKITQGHAKVLLGMENHKEMLLLVEKTIKESLSVRGLEKEVLKLKKPSAEKESLKPNAIEQRSVQKVEEDLQKSLGTKVSIDYQNGKGKIVIQFYSNDELSEISERILAGCMN